MLHKTGLKRIISAILIVAILSLLVGGHYVQGSHFTVPSTNLLLKECNDENIEIPVSPKKVKQFCHEIEDLTSTFLQDFNHALLTDDYSGAEHFLNLYHTDFHKFLNEFVV